jgi:c-di-AMP phosphodiesterase-like protein
LFDIYDTDAFEDSMISKIKNNLCNTMLDDTDIMVLAIEQHRINNHLAGVEKGFHTGNLKMNNKYYSVVFCSNDKYLNNTFDHMKDIYPDYDLYIINYGSGIGVRATKPDINVGAILKTIGGGGHAGAGGVKISLENQAAYLANALSADLYVDDPKDK